MDPAHEAVQLWEHYREAQRLREVAQHGARMVDLLKTAEAEVKEAEILLRAFATKPQPETRIRLDETFDAMGKRCASCHRAYRDTSAASSR